jgi:hypothetical protein
LAYKISQGVFDYYTLDYFDSDDAIVAYKIKSADLESIDDEPCVRVQYDVKPTHWSYFNWDAGNGEEGSAGWLVDKSEYYSYKKYGDFYFIYSVGTGP